MIPLASRVPHSAFARRPAISRRSQNRNRRPRLLVENLEERSTPATIMVTNVNDAGTGSFRLAITTANGTAAADTIVFDPAVFNTPKTISLLTALPQLPAAGGALTITGPGAANLTIRRDPGAATAFRVLNSLAPTLTLTGFTVSGGSVAGDGGGLLASNAAFLDGMVFTGNATTGNATSANCGGGIGIGTGGFLSVRNSTISGNTSADAGGGIYFLNGGGLVMENSTVSGNITNGTSADAGGGGIYFFGVAGGNVPAGFTPNTLVVRNSTIANNTAVSSGGGILVTSFTGNLLVQNCTVSGNTANNTTAGQGGGGITRTTGPGTITTANSVVTITNSVVSGNTNTNGPDILSPGSINVNFSAVGNATGFTLTTGSGNNIAPGTNLQLGALASNGGPTETMIPAAGSPLINAASDGLVPINLTSDQRGFGFVRTFETADIGAAEVQPTGFPIGIATAPNTTALGATSYTFTVTYSDPFGSNNGINVASVIDNNSAVRVTGPNGFDAPATFVSIDNATNGSPRTATYTITPPGGAWDLFDRGNYVVRIQANQVADLDGTFAPAASAGFFNFFTPNFTVLNADDSGTGSLRQVIEDANLSPAADTITFDPSFFNVPRTISLQSALPQFLASGGALTVTGPGASLVTVQRDAAAVTDFRIFDSLAPTLTMTGLTVSGGKITADGAGLLMSGNVTLDSVVFSNNQATGANDGGAIRVNQGGLLTLRNSTLTGNTAGKCGGGIYFVVDGSLVLENSTISGNSAAGTGAVDGGGGIYFYGAATTVPPPGFTPGTLIVRNSTIVDNTTAGSGGAINLVLFTGNLLVQNSTITGNTANATASGLGGGGIARIPPVGATSGVFTVANSIVSGNNNANGPDILSSNTVNVNFSAIGSNTGFTPSATSGNNLAAGANLLLGNLAGNGGPTQTRLPGAGSPLIDAGSGALAAGVGSDQRGLGFARTFGAPDIGAVEVQPDGLPVATATAPSVTAAGATSYTFTVTFTDLTGANPGINTTNLIGNNSAVRVTGPGGFDAPATFVSIDNPANGSPRTVTYSVVPPGGAWDPLDGGSFSINVQANQVADLDGNFVPAGPAGGFVVNIPNFLVLNNNDFGFGSFRQALAFAAADPGANTITFDPTFFSTPRTITLQSALAQIPAAGGALTITGPGAANLTLRRDPGAVTTNAAYNFSVLNSAAPTLNLSGFTVTGGRSATDGGGLLVAGTNPVITLDGMVISGNQATAGEGGGVCMNVAGFLMVKNSTISGNTASTDGGGIYFFNGGGLVVENSTISGNAANGATSIGGGGIYFFGTPSASPPAGFTPSTLVIRNSTIANNTSAVAGGGIALQSFAAAGTLLVQNSTISGNTAATTGGAISLNSGSVTLRNTTVSGNTATVSGGAVAVTGGTGTTLVQGSTIVGNTANGTAAGQGGGGIARTTTTAGGVVTVENSIVSGNTNANGPDILTGATGSTVNVNFSAVGSNTGFTLSGTSGNNLAFGTNLQLGALATNGGSTQTMAPAAGSPLINAGSNALVPAGVTTDQRAGTFDRIFDTTVDIGAFEVQPAKVTINQAGGQQDPTNQPFAIFNVVFNLPVTGFDGSDISFAGSTAPGTLAANVTGGGNGTNFIVTVSGITGDGTVVASIPAGAAIDPFGAGTQASTSTDNTVTFDFTSPGVTIEQAAGQADPANTGPVTFTVHFSEPVTGFTGSDVSFAGSTVGGTLVADVTGSGADYTVTVSGMDGTGTIVASIPAGVVTDPAGNPNTASTSSDNSVAFDNVPPAVTIDQATGQVDPVNVGPITFTVHFSEPVTGFDATDVSLAGSTVGGTLVAEVTGSGQDFTVTATGMSGVGTVVAAVAAGAVTDAAGNPSSASTSTDNTVTFDEVAPTVTIDQAPGQADPTSDGAIAFTVHFSEPVTGFTGSAVSFVGSTVGGTLVANVSGSGADYTVTVTGMVGEGLLVASIPAGAVADAAGNANAASTSTDNQVTVFSGGQLQFSSAVYTATENGGSITITVDRVNGVTGAVSVDFATSAGTATPGAAGDYDNISGTLSWADSESGSKSFVITLHDDRAVEPTETVSLTLSNPTGVAVTLGTPSTATLNIADLEEGQFDFSAPVYTTTEEGSFATITVTRTGGSVGPVSVHYSTADGTAFAGGVVPDYTTTSGTLSWIDGDSSSKSFNVPILQDTQNEGKELINLALDTPTGNAVIGPQVTAQIPIAPSDPLTGTIITFFEEDGDKVTAKVAGTAKMEIYRTDPDSNNKGPIELIVLTNNQPDPLKQKPVTVNLTVTKPRDVVTDGRVGLGAVTGTGLKALTLNAKAFNLDGAGIQLDGPLTAVTLGDIKNGADIVALGAPTQKTKITAGRIGDGTTIDVDTALTSLSAIRFGTGSINAPSIGALTIRGDVRNSVVGDFAADVTVTGAGVLAGKPALRAFKVAGSVLGSDIAVTGLVTSLSAGAINGGSITAGGIGAVSVKGDMSADVTLSGTGVLAGKPALGALTVGGNVPVGADVVAPSVGTVLVKGNLSGDINVSGAGVLSGKPALKSLKVTGSILGSDIHVNGLVTSVSAGTFPSGSITADGIGTVAVIGDMGGDLTVTGVGIAVGKPALASLTVGGAVTGSDIKVDGNVNLVRVAAFRDSRLFVGYDGPDNGIGGTFHFATLSSFLVTGASEAFQDSRAIAFAFKTVSLKSVDFDNGGEMFGVYADSTIGSLKVLGPQPFTYDPSGPAAQGVPPNFEVVVV